MNKRSRSKHSNDEVVSRKKKKYIEESSSLYKCLQENGITLREPPEKCLATQESVMIVRNIKKYILNQVEYPRNVSEIISELSKMCEDLDVFKHLLFPNVTRHTEDNEEFHVSDSVLKVLLNVTLLQSKLIDFIFEKAMDLAVENKCGPWIQMILRCLSSLDSIEDTEKISSHLVNLLDVTTEKMVRLEIITAIPDIVGDGEHENIAQEMSRFLSEDHDLIPAILDCLSYLCLNDDQYELLQKKTLHILMGLPKSNYYSNFIKFLLMSGRVNDSANLETIKGIRNALNWPYPANKPQEVATSQILTAAAIRNTIVSSKHIGNSWIKVLSSCKESTDTKPIDIVIMIVLYSTSDERQKQIENLIRKQVKLNILKEELLKEAFTKYKPIIKEYLQKLILLSNNLLKSFNDPVIETFASYMYGLLMELDDCRQTVIAELLQLGLDRKQCVMNILMILNQVATKDMALLKPQSLQMLTLLDRMDGMSLSEIRGVMNLVCGLAYSYENSMIRDDIHMIIRKELGSSSPTVKIQGILAGVHAVKYLMRSADDDHTVETADDISYSSVTHLAEGPLREAAQVIELLSRSTRQLPDMIAFFYDELSNVISDATHINKQFMGWLTDAVTNDLQQNFIVDSIANDKVGELKLTMQYCLNADGEMDEVIAINIAGLVLDTQGEINVGIISPLFQLVQTLHYKQHKGDLSSIDALLGCPVVMPQFDIDLIEDYDNKSLINLLDCLIHCVNWFRELLNAFATQNDIALKGKIVHRILQIEDIESLIGQILLKSQIAYKPPICFFDICKYSKDYVEKKPIKTTIPKQKPQKNSAKDNNDTTLPDTARTQATTQNNTVKNKLGIIDNLPFRHLNIKLLHLFNNELSAESNPETELNIRTFKFLLKYVNANLESVLISKFKKKTFLTKLDDNLYNATKAEECANKIDELLPKFIEHMKFITNYIEINGIDKNYNDTTVLNTTVMVDFLDSLEYLYKLLTIYFKWIGFRNHHQALLKSSLRSILSVDCSSSTLMSLKDLVTKVVQHFQKHDKYCLHLPTAIALIDLLQGVSEHSQNRNTLAILRDMANIFLSQQWRTVDGALEKGLMFNQSVDKLASIYFLNKETVALKNLAVQLTSDIQMLQGRNDTLSSMKCITKANFPVLYRNLGTAVYDAAKTSLSKGLTNSEHLDLWKDVATTLKYMADIAKSLENRNNLSAFFKKSLPIIKLFVSQGIPILEMQLKSKTDQVLEILKILQQSTRFLQSLCCHSRLKKDTVLMNKVPLMRHMLETLIYRVKAALAANDCSEAFWMGNLKNKNLQGEVISTQQSVESEESVEDCDDQLPEDNSDDSDDEMINPDSRSVSDVI